MQSSFPIDLVIFDCDGTLVDSETVVAEVLAESATEQGIPMSAEEAFRRFKGGRMADCIKVLENLRGSPLPESFIGDFRKRSNAVLQERLQPMEGALELLEAMHLPFCMASNGQREKMEVTLGTTGLRHFFEERIYSAYEVNAWKPDPELFLHAARRHNADPSRCVVVEDSLPGVEAGVAAGMRVFVLDESADSGETWPEGVTVIHDLHELQEHLILPERRTSKSSARYSAPPVSTLA
jgi:HAD superfamily hydrolase (TIGR01509 family)